MFELKGYVPEGEIVLARYECIDRPETLAAPGYILKCNVRSVNSNEDLSSRQVLGKDLPKLLENCHKRGIHFVSDSNFVAYSGPAYSKGCYQVISPATKDDLIGLLRLLHEQDSFEGAQSSEILIR